MTLEIIHSFLVHPAKNEEEQPRISGTAVPLRGQPYSMLSGLFDRAPAECNIEIVFQPDEQGRQNNNCRDELVEYAQRPTVSTGRTIASRLQSVTTHRSGLGLIFLLKGSVGNFHRLVISRFPADQGILAKENARNLTVRFIDRIFMKNSHAYKSVIYSSDSFDRGFWRGKAIDRQISGLRELSDYWIRDFLLSELLTTGPAGTKRLAVCLRSAILSATDIGTRRELISMAGLLRGRDGTILSARQLITDLALSPEATCALTAAFPREDLVEESFQFDLEEFNRHILYRAIELDNGGLMIAEDARFSEVFRSEVLNDDESMMRYITEGRVVAEKLRKNK